MSETRAEMIRRWEQEGWIFANCPQCEVYYDFKGLVKYLRKFESGKRSHCTCGVCW